MSTTEVFSFSNKTVFSTADNNRLITRKTQKGLRNVNLRSNTFKNIGQTKLKQATTSQYLIICSQFNAAS